MAFGMISQQKMRKKNLPSQSWIRIHDLPLTGNGFQKIDTTSLQLLLLVNVGISSSRLIVQLSEKIIHEINFSTIQNLKNCILIVLFRGSDLFLVFSSDNMQKFTKTKIQMCFDFQKSTLQKNEKFSHKNFVKSNLL